MIPQEPEYPPEIQHWFNVRDELFLLTDERGIQAWAHIANCLFYAIARRYDLTTARTIFGWAGPMTRTRMQTQVDNVGLLQRLAEMKPKNIARLADETAKENKKRAEENKKLNKKLPKARRRGAGSTDPTALEDHIRHLDKIGMDKLWRRLLAESVSPSKLNK